MTLRFASSVAHADRYAAAPRCHGRGIEPRCTVRVAVVACRSRAISAPVTDSGVAADTAPDRLRQAVRPGDRPGARLSRAPPADQPDEAEERHRHPAELVHPQRSTPRRASCSNAMRPRVEHRARHRQQLPAETSVRADRARTTTTRTRRTACRVDQRQPGRRLQEVVVDPERAGAEEGQHRIAPFLQRLLQHRLPNQTRNAYDVQVPNTSS